MKKTRNPHALQARRLGARVMETRHHKRSRSQNRRDAIEQEMRDHDRGE